MLDSLQESRPFKNGNRASFSQLKFSILVVSVSTDTLEVTTFALEHLHYIALAIIYIFFGLCAHALMR